jgi:kinesin family protein 1
MAEENVKVAVRVRPFNQREKDAKSKLIVAMEGVQTIVSNPKTNEEKKYAFDYSYW